MPLITRKVVQVGWSTLCGDPRLERQVYGYKLSGAETAGGSQNHIACTGRLTSSGSARRRNAACCQSVDHEINRTRNRGALIGQLDLLCIRGTQEI